MRRRLVTLRPLAAALTAVCAVMVAGCSDGPDEGEPTAEVGGVHLRPPDGWVASDAGTPPGVVAARRWAADDAGLRAVQVVVGCDPSGLDGLVEGAVGRARGALVVTGAEERPAPAVDGFEAVRRLSLTLGAGREDDAASLRTEALYGQSGDALVLVEVSAPIGRPDVSTAERVLESVRADPDVLRQGCPTDE